MTPEKFQEKLQAIKEWIQSPHFEDWHGEPGFVEDYPWEMIVRLYEMLPDNCVFVGTSGGGCLMIEWNFNGTYLDIDVIKDPDGTYQIEGIAGVDKQD